MDEIEVLREEIAEIRRDFEDQIEQLRDDLSTVRDMIGADQ